MRTVRKPHAREVTEADKKAKNTLFGSPRPSTAKPAPKAKIDTSRARVTIAPPKLDLRFQASPDHVGEFSRLGVGRYAE